MPLPYRYFTRNTGRNIGRNRPGTGLWPISLTKSMRKSGANGCGSCGSAIAALILIAAVVLVVAGIAGWRGYEYYQAQRAAESGAQFEAASALAEGRQAGRGGGGLRQDRADRHLGLSRAGAPARRPRSRSPRDKAAAVKDFDAITADDSVDRKFRDLAAIRAGFLLVDSAPLADMEQRLEPLTGAQAHLPSYRARIARAVGLPRQGYGGDQALVRHDRRRPRKPGGDARACRGAACTRRHREGMTAWRRARDMWS